MTSEIVNFDLEDPRNRRVASEIVDLLFFYRTGVGRPRDEIHEYSRNHQGGDDPSGDAADPIDIKELTAFVGAHLEKR